MRISPSLTITLAAVLLPSSLLAEGLIDRLPEDGSWVRFEADGAGIGSDGNVRVKVAGTLTLSSVGHAIIDGKDCRWIELDTNFKFQRGAREGESSEVVKMLIPEKFLRSEENPRDHVLKAWKQDSSGVVKELDLEGDGRREIQSLDELLSGPLEETKALEPAVVESKLGKLECDGRSGREVQPSGSILTTKTRLHEKAPFGIVTYHYDKQRGGGKRTMTFKLADYGTDAKSRLPDKK